MGNAVHQLHIDLVTYAAGFAILLHRSRAAACGRVVYRHRSCGCLLQQFRCLADTIGYLTLDDPFAIKPIHGHLGICRHDDAVRFRNFLCCQHVLGTGRAPCLHLDAPASGSCCFLQALGCHIGMGDTGRAGGHRQDPRLLFLCLTDSAVFVSVLRARRICSRRFFRSCCQTVIDICLLFISLIND